MSSNRPKSLEYATLALSASVPGSEAAQVLDVLSQGVCVVEGDGSVRWGNRAYFGYPARVRARVASMAREAALAAARGTGAGGRLAGLAPPLTVGRLALAKSGRFFEVTFTALALGGGRSSGDAAAAAPAGLSPTGPAPGAGLSPDGAGGAAGGGGGGSGGGGGGLAIVAVVRDVTRQERLRRKIFAIDRAGSELAHFDAETVKKMHVAERLRLLESKVIKAAHDLLNFDHFTVRLLNQETKELELVMSTGLSPEACAIRLKGESTGNGISGYVAAMGRSYICRDARSDPLYVRGLDQAGSSLTVPLRLFDRVIGIFNIESGRLSAFKDQDRLLAEIFARYVATALHILNLLLVERYTTRVQATGVVQGELSEPLNDLIAEAEALKDQALDPEVGRHVERILKDVDSIRRRVKNVARGPQTLLGAEEAIADSDVDPVLEGKRLLVVDNEPEIAGVIRDVLARRGMQVTVCDDGASAKKLLLQWQVTQDPDQGFDVVLSDINLGDATGYEVFASAKAASAPLPVILMTGFGYDPHHSIVRASQEGLQCVLFKPFQAEKLIEEVKKALAPKA